MKIHFKLPVAKKISDILSFCIIFVILNSQIHKLELFNAEEMKYKIIPQTEQFEILIEIGNPRKFYLEIF
jgi:hypothetical protein